MQVISIEEQSFYQLLDTVLAEMEEKFGKKEEEWIHETNAMKLLGIKSKTSMQRLRDHDLIRFTQPSRKIILYYKPSLLEYLDAHANK